MRYTIKQAVFLLAMLVLLLITPVDKAHADLYQDVQNVLAGAQALDVQLKGTTLSAASLCGPLVAANQSARNLVNSITRINAALAEPLQIDAATLSALDSLSNTALSLANEGLRLSVDLKMLSGVANALTLKDGIVAMLQLADDIGTMADRIGEMSDKILAMSDNIGLMADRILVTQQLQSQNLRAVQQGMVQTQQNSVLVVSVVETATNDLTLSRLVTEGNLLAAQLSAIVVNPMAMKTQLANAATAVQTYLGKVVWVQALVQSQALSSTSYVSAASLLHQQNLAIMTTSLGTALEGYAVAISGLQAITSTPTLSASLKSMLQLSADIGLMADRILEMGDSILKMADNIGMMADQILAVQQVQTAQVAATRASVLTAQTFAVNLIQLKRL